MNDFVIEKEGQEIVLKKYNGNDEQVVVPEGVTRIGMFVFSNDNLKSVSIPDSVRFIDRMAFPKHGEELADEKGICAVGRFLLSYVGNDSTVVIPEGITDILFCAFAGNNNIKKVVFPSTIEVIGNQSFCKCGDLEEVEFAGNGKNLRLIDFSAFSDCTNLIKFDMPDRAISTGRGAFFGCSKLERVGDFTIIGSMLIRCNTEKEEILVPKGIKSIGAEAFKDCKSARRVILPEGVELIGEHAFSFLKSLQEVNIPESVEYIMDSAFSCCENLEAVDLKNVKYIGKSAFSVCARLTLLSQPEKLEAIGPEAFQTCQSIKHIVLPNSLKKIGNNEVKKPETFSHKGVFEGSGLQTVVLPESISVIEYNTFEGTKLKEVVIPESVNIIGDNAFRGCSLLESVTIPESVTEIGDGAFLGCPKLNDIKLPQSLSSDDTAGTLFRLGGSDKNGCLIDGKTLKRCDSIDGVATVTDGVEIISEDAFVPLFWRFGGSHPSKVMLPDSVKRIEVVYFDKQVDMNIPNGYLQQKAKLPVKSTIALIEGPWKSKTSMKDYACLYLYQGGAQLQKECRQVFDKSVEEACRAMIEVLNEKSGTNAFKKAAEYILNNQESISQDMIAELHYKAKECKANATAKVLEPFVVRSSRDSCLDQTAENNEFKTNGNATIETFCKEKFVPFLFDEFLKKKKVPKKYFKTVKYKGSEEYAPEFVVECAVVPYMLQLEEVPKNIGGYKKDYPRFRIEPDADRVASTLDPQSISEMLDSMFEKTLPPNYQCFVPFGRYGTSAQIQDMMSRMNKWKDWYRYSSSGRMAIMVARGAIMLNDSKEAAQYAEKNRLIRYYADIRGCTEKEIIDRINSIAYEIDKTMSIADAFGLDDNGIRKMTDDGIEAYIDGSLKLALRDKNGKDLKSIRGDKEAQSVYVTLKKEIDAFVKERKKDIFKLYFRNDALSEDIWVEKFASHPVLKPLTKAVIWSDEKGKGFVLTDDGIIDVDEVEYTPQGKIRPAHVLDLSEEETEKWRKYLLKHKTSLLIEQIWEPIIAYSPRKISGRYTDIVLTNKERSKFKSTLKAKNIDVRSDLNESQYDPYQGTRVFSDTNSMSLGSSMTITYKIDPETKDITLGSDLKIRTTASKYEINAILFELDRFALKSFIARDEAENLNQAILDAFSAAQIIEFIDFASKNKSTNCAAVLQQYRNEKYPEYDAFSEFMLD